MNSITEFKREFGRTAQGYSPAEVDAAVNMLVSYGAELESANHEFAEVNDDLIAQNDALAADNERLAAENRQLREEYDQTRQKLDTYLEKYGEAKNLLAEAKRRADAIRAAAEAEVSAQRAAQNNAEERAQADLHERCAAEERRYAALCRRTRTLVDAVKSAWQEQLAAIEALSESLDEDVPPVQAASVEPAKVKSFTPPPPQKPQVRRAAMAAAALEREPSAAAQPSRAKPVAQQPVKAPSDEPVSRAEPITSTTVFPTQGSGDTERAERVALNAVYREAPPSPVKVTRAEMGGKTTPSHSFAAVRRTLEEIGSRSK